MQAVDEAEHDLVLSAVGARMQHTDPEAAVVLPQGVDHIIPVDIYLPGCPPRPEMLLNAIIELHAQIQGSKLGVNRIAAARAAEAAALAATPTSLMAPTHDHLAHLAAPSGKNLLA